MNEACSTAPGPTAAMRPRLRKGREKQSRYDQHGIRNFGLGITMEMPETYVSSQAGQSVLRMSALGQ
jgi:hypothetical protein